LLHTGAGGLVCRGEMAGREGREYQEARITDTLGNTFVGQVAAFGPATAQLERVLCVKAQPRYAHKPLRDERTRGSIVVVERGRVTFQEKALRVQEVGGVACVFVNTSDEPFVAFADGDAAAATRPPVTIPCCCVGKSDGDWLSKSTNLVNLSFEPPGGWGAEPSPTPAAAGPGISARGLSAAGAAPARTATPAAASAAAARASSARAKFTYRSDHERDLCFTKGETIELLSEAEPGSGWWTGRIGARTGIFPSNYVERLAAEPAAAQAAAAEGAMGPGHLVKSAAVRRPREQHLPAAQQQQQQREEEEARTADAQLTSKSKSVAFLENQVLYWVAGVKVSMLTALCR
jgi:hypothetical protein